MSRLGGLMHYRVGAKVAETAAYRLYLCEEVDTGASRFLQIATAREHNGQLDRAAYRLGELSKSADFLEEAFAKENPGRQLGYNLLFPAVTDSFIAEGQGGRRALITQVRNVEDIRQLVPLGNLRLRDGLRLDCETSAWIMERLLKLAAFAHAEGVAVHGLSSNNVLIEPVMHYAVVFDWSTSRSFDNGVPMRERAADIVSAASTVFGAIGGDPTTGDYPYSEVRVEPYIALLRQLMNGRANDAETTHRQFYKLVHGLFGKTYQPFTTLPL